MSIYTESQIENLYLSSLDEAIDKLKQVQVYCGNEPNLKGLRGWVFEQTIHYCIKKELKAGKVKVSITEQPELVKRMKPDLGIGNVAIEIKVSGLYSPNDIDKYERYRKALNKIGVQYLFITGVEGYLPYRDRITRVLGKDNVFFLDTDGEWKRFIDRVVRLLN